MGIVANVADDLALESLKFGNATVDDAFVLCIADTIGGSSQTMGEADLTAVRVRDMHKTIKGQIAGAARDD